MNPHRFGRVDSHPAHRRSQITHAFNLDTTLADGFGRVWLPDAIDRKFPAASRDWRWQWVFPAPTRWKSETTEGRHHYHETNVQRP